MVLPFVVVLVAVVLPFVVVLFLVVLVLVVFLFFVVLFALFLFRLVVFVVLFALFLFIFVVVFELHAGGESNGLDVVSHMEHRRTGFLHRFQGVTQAFFEVETVGHDHDGAFHPAPILQ